MSADFAATPPKWALTQEPIWVEVETDNVDTSPSVAQFILAFGDDLTAGQTLLIAWANESLTLTVAASPTGNLEIPTTTSSEGSVQNLIDYLYRQPAIARDWDIQYQPTGDHRLVANYRGTDEIDVTVTLTGGVSGPSITVTDKGDPYLEENLTAYLQVMQQDTDLSSAYLREYVGSYDPATARAVFDISKSFPLRPHIPAYTADSFAYERAEQAFAQYRIQCSDRYGDPPLPDRAEPVTSRLAIYGGAPLDSAFSLDPGSDTLQLLHHYVDPDGNAIRKPIGYNGVDYVAFVMVDDGSLSFKVRAYYQDGTDQRFNLHASPIDFYADEVNYVQSGPAQLDLENEVTDWEDVVRYDFEIWSETGDSALKGVVSYELDWKIRPWFIDLLYPNGCGGVEVLRALGKATFGTRAQRATAERQATPDDDATEGRYFTFNTVGQDTIEVEVGWYRPEYLHHIAQVIYQDVWALEGGEWIRYVVDADSITIRKDDNLIGSFNFRISKAITQSNRVR